MQKPPTGHEINQHPTECCLALTGVGNSICSCSHCGWQPTEVLTPCSILTTNLVGKTVKVALFFFFRGMFHLLWPLDKKKLFPSQLPRKAAIRYGPAWLISSYSVCHFLQLQEWYKSDDVGTGSKCRTLYYICRIIPEIRSINVS